MKQVSLLAAAFASAFALDVPPAHAQSGAATLYASGDAALSRQQFGDAFRDCSAALGLLANAPREQLGRAQYCVAQAAQGLGRTATAIEYATMAIQNIEQAGSQLPRYQADLRHARVMVRELTPRLARVVLEITPAGLGGLRATIDGAEVPAAMLTAAIPHDPGQALIAVTVPGFQPVTVDANLRAGEVRRVPVHFLRSNTIGQIANGRGENPALERTSLAEMFGGRWWMSELMGLIGYLHEDPGGADTPGICPPCTYTRYAGNGFLGGLSLSGGLRISENSYLGLRVAAYASWGRFYDAPVILTGSFVFWRQLSGFFSMAVSADLGADVNNTTQTAAYYDPYGVGGRTVITASVQRGIVVGGSLEASIALASGHSGSAILSLRPGVMVNPSDPSIIFSLPLGIGYRWR